MKNKNLYIICIAVFILTVVVIFFINRKDPDKPSIPISTDYKLHKDFIKIERDYEEEKIETNYVFTSYQEYSKYFDDKTISESDFENNNMLLVYVDYLGCSERDVYPTDYKIDGNTINITVKYKKVCGLCAPVQDLYLLKVDKSVTSMEVVINSIAVSSEICNPNVVYKPLIYLYPVKETDVKVKLSNSNLITTSYPKYVNGWDVKAYPNGKLIDNSTSRELYGLYWEGSNYNAKVSDTGFVVKGEDTIKFLEEKLELLGLNERESNEFIIYWLPKLEHNNYNYIRFEDLDVINNYMPLEVTPNPDSIIRVYMNYKPLDKYIEVKEQKINKPTRKGFTLVEWGGSEITY